MHWKERLEALRSVGRWEHALHLALGILQVFITPLKDLLKVSNSILMWAEVLLCAPLPWTRGNLERLLGLLGRFFLRGGGGEGVKPVLSTFAPCRTLIRSSLDECSSEFETANIRFHAILFMLSYCSSGIRRASGQTEFFPSSCQTYQLVVLIRSKFCLVGDCRWTVHSLGAPGDLQHRKRVLHRRGEEVWGWSTVLELLQLTSQHGYSVCCSSMWSQKFQRRCLKGQRAPQSLPR